MGVKFLRRTEKINGVLYYKEVKKFLERFLKRNELSFGQFIALLKQTGLETPATLTKYTDEKISWSTQKSIFPATVKCFGKTICVTKGKEERKFKVTSDKKLELQKRKRSSKGRLLETNYPKGSMEKELLFGGKRIQITIQIPGILEQEEIVHEELDEYLINLKENSPIQEVLSNVLRMLEIEDTSCAEHISIYYYEPKKEPKSIVICNGVIGELSFMAPDDDYRIYDENNWEYYNYSSQIGFVVKDGSMQNATVRKSESLIFALNKVFQEANQTVLYLLENCKF